MLSDSSPDTILLEYLRQDDVRAFQLIYDRYWQKLYALAKAKSQSETVAEDVLQSVFIKLWERRKEQHIEALEAYLLTAIKYGLISHFRHVFSKRQHETLVSEDHPITSSSEWEADDLKQHIESILATLPEKTYLIFTLSRFEERSHKEIAAQLNLSEKSIEYHITQALKVLRLHLQDYLPLWIAVQMVLA